MKSRCPRRPFPFAVVSVCAAAMLLLVACGPSDEPPSEPGAEPVVSGDPVRGDWLVLHLLSDPESLNPLTSNDSGATRVLNWIFPALLRLDEASLELRPALATALPTVSADRLTYTFTLRPDITFSDGQPLTAHDVVFTMKATRHPKVRAPHARNYFESVGDVVAVDDTTVRFDLGKVYFRNDYTLGFVQPIPRHYYDPEGLLDDITVAELNDWDALSPEKRQKAEQFAKAFNEAFHRRPVGPGAFALENPERDFITGERIVLKHREDFWAPGETDFGDAWVDRVVFRVINDREAALVSHKAGDLDVIGLTPIQALKQTNTARFKERSDKHQELFGSYTYIGWNQKRELFRDKRVRQALSHLVDKQNIVDKVMLTLAQPVESPIFSKRPEYDEDLKPWPFDVDRARALLEEAGWTDSDGDGILDKEIDGARVPLRFELISNAGNEERKKTGLVVIDQFKQAGIDASFRSVDWSIMLEKVKNFDYDAVVLGWTGGASTPPDAYQIWHSSQAIPGGSNFIAFENAEVDDILERYRVEFDFAKRKALYKRFQEILYDEQPYTFLYAPVSVTAWDRRFNGVEWYPGVGPDMNDWWVPTALQRH